MGQYIAFLRAVNVGGTGKLPMSELRQMCGKLGFTGVKTYIASGNVLFSSGKKKTSVKAALKRVLTEYAGKEVGVVVYEPKELQRIFDNNPFKDNGPGYTVAVLVDGVISSEAVGKVTGKTNERLHAANSEVYVHYPNGIGPSKLNLRDLSKGTARKMSTIEKMLELSSISPPDT